MIDGRKLVNYLAHGISHSQIALALNLTQARVTQLAEEDKIKVAVEKRTRQIEEQNLTDIADLKSIKATLIRRMSDLAEATDSLGEATRALQAIEDMTSKKLGQEDDLGGVKSIILNVPIFIQNSVTGIKLDSINRITSINERSMAQMPTKGVLDILQGKSHVSKASNTEEVDLGSIDLSSYASQG